MDEKFHILENVTLYDRGESAKGQRGPTITSTALNFHLEQGGFQSFSAGNLKRLDFDFSESLRSALAKRLYRFLDKRFFHRGRWEFNLKEFSWEHVGLSRNYDAANLKRALRPAIRELEKRGFLKTMPEHHRFYRIRRSEWRVVFERARQTRQAAEQKRNPAL